MLLILKVLLVSGLMAMRIIQFLFLCCDRILCPSIATILALVKNFCGSHASTASPSAEKFVKGGQSTAITNHRDLLAHIKSPFAEVIIITKDVSSDDKLRVRETFSKLLL